MKTQFIEVDVAGEVKYYMIAQFIGFEWDRPMHEGENTLLNNCGWERDDLMVFDLADGAGYRVRPKEGLKFNFETIAAFNAFLRWLFKQNMTKDLPMAVRFDTNGKVLETFYGVLTRNASQGGKYGKHRQEVPAGHFHQAKSRAKNAMAIHAARTDDYRALCGSMVFAPDPKSPLFDAGAADACGRCVNSVRKVMVGA